MAWLKGVALVASVLVLLVTTLVLVGAARWARGTATLRERLEAARQPIRPARYDAAAELAGLPSPVQRFFRTVLTDGQPIVAAVTVRQRGTFDLGDATERWKPFTGWQRVVTRRAGFVWDARIAIAPGVPVYVHDAYVAGEGILAPAILGLVPLADLRGRSSEDGGIAQGELMRFLAEAAWYPTALLPSQGVRWEPVDDRSARATIADGPLSVTLTFTFADDGTTASVRAAGRGRTVGGKVVPTPWEGRWFDHRMRHGMRIPVSGEVAWLTPEGRRPYWRGTIEAADHEFAD